MLCRAASVPSQLSTLCPRFLKRYCSHDSRGSPRHTTGSMITNTDSVRPSPRSLRLTSSSPTLRTPLTKGSTPQQLLSIFRALSTKQTTRPYLLLLRERTAQSIWFVSSPVSLILERLLLSEIRDRKPVLLEPPSGRVAVLHGESANRNEARQNEKV